MSLPIFCPVSQKLPSSWQSGGSSLSEVKGLAAQFEGSVVFFFSPIFHFFDMVRSEKQTEDLLGVRMKAGT